MCKPRWFVVVFLALLGGGCETGAIKVPKSTEPVLESVRVMGKRICGSIVTAGTAYTFDCPSLPTSKDSGWQLTPGWAPSASSPQRLHSNRTAVINVSAPSLTEIDVELVRASDQQNLPLQQVEADVPGSPGEVSATRQVGVTTIDDGTKKTWLIEVNVSTCADSRHIQIFNRSSRNPDRSNPLNVYLLRNPNEQICITQSGPSPALRPGLGEPVNARPAGGCAGGGTGTLFQMCEYCAALQPPGLNIYSAGTYCSWDEVLAAYGYAGPAAIKAHTCVVNQVTSPEACEGAP